MILSILVTLIFLGIYNRYFHPLSHIPGPFWSSVTDLFKLYVLLSQDLSTMGIELHKKYGPVVRVAPNMLSFSDPYMIPRIYHKKADKSDFWTPGALGRPPAMIQVKDHQEHAAKRRILAPAISGRNLIQLEHRLDERLSRTMNALDTGFAFTHKSCNLPDWVRWFLYDAFTDMTFGEVLDFTGNEKDVYGMLQAFRGSAWIIGLTTMFPWIMGPLYGSPMLSQYFLPSSRDKDGVGKMMRLRNKFIKNNLLNPTETQDCIFNKFLQSQSMHPVTLSTDDIKAEVLMMMAAAPDTTLALICSVVDNIIRNPQVYQELEKEIEILEVQGLFSCRVVSYADVQCMPYLSACILEASRICPPVPVLLPRRISKGGVRLNGIYVPEGAEVGASPPVINNNELVFGPQTDISRPERWMGDAENISVMKRYLFSWGWGSRKCVARSLSLMETSKFCAQVCKLLPTM
ncbi:cytochrome P450 [Mollisia scopiformis]|uniref:Cytochrome P450 n=1 Tax=Mollisia scopiformis TaxID=149040 RepID=A0A194XVW0_MOLSC|nr:cytochrome P450 [Mollisia scopiformis]KUJ24271.1 cytochrome P450 [Mollisia scopiformis]